MSKMTRRFNDFDYRNSHYKQNPSKRYIALFKKNQEKLIAFISQFCIDIN